MFTSAACTVTPWAERAWKCGYPERFAQQALGHNSQAVHHAYSKPAEVTVPSLDDGEKQWRKNPQEMQKPKLVPVDFHAPQAAPSSTANELPVAAGVRVRSWARGDGVARWGVFLIAAGPRLAASSVPAMEFANSPRE